jgi:hypothetical protein
VIYLLYILNDSNKHALSTLERVTLESIGWNEKDLENMLINNLDRFLSEEALMPIFRERSHQEEPDIMAMDRIGNLYFLELKRWKSNQENLLQVFRYGQIFGQSDYEQLNLLYQKYNLGGKGLREGHGKFFNLSPDELLEERAFNKKQYFLIVTDGTDYKTREAINYWKGLGLAVDAIIYRVYLAGNNEKLIEFNTYNPQQDVIEYEECCYFVNTNIKNDTQCDLEMLSEKKAAAYYSPWKEKINKIQKSDKVFLYRSGQGIIAMGLGTGKVFKKDYEGRVAEEYYTPLDNFVPLLKPLNASEIKSIAKSNIIFRQTMFEVSKDLGDLIWNYINKNCRK